MCYLVILDEDSDEDVVAKEDPIHALFSDSDSESIGSDF